MPNANEERSEGTGAFAFQAPPLIWRGGRIKQQQKLHPPGDCGLHPLPSLPHIPCSPLWLPQGPPDTLGGTLWLARGSTVPAPGPSLSWLLMIPQRGEGRAGHEACSQGWMALPWPCQQAVALPRLQLCPLELTPHAGQILPATPPCPTPCLSPSWPQAFPKTACAWAPCPPASPHRNGPGLCLLSGGGVAV